MTPRCPRILARGTASGFTLIEVMTSMVILSIGLLVTLPLVSSALAKTIHGRKTTAAQFIGNTVLDRLRFEIRFDPPPLPTVSCGGGTTGCTNGGPFTLEDAWESEHLAHSPDDVLGDPAACNPPGAGEVLAFNIGPFPVRLEGNTYWVCYNLENSISPGVLPNSVDATVRVFWATPVGYGGRTITSVLLPFN
ncbi:MAG TPA: prepilin-type N-terminal cleavage/methylation domain-containing protein [Vulgatibacter sp.]|nr:prepilin-type N-terminal cleavage/methylation domain-containing protein [Vulgatibacter sp.]